MSHQKQLLMKKKNLLRLLFPLIILTAYSCNTPKVGYFHNTYKPYVKNEKPTEGIVSNESFTAVESDLTKPELKISEIGNQAITQKKNSFSTQQLETFPKTILPSKELKGNERKAIKKEIKAEFKKLKNNETEVNTLLLVIIAILLPPVAVALVDGFTGPFWLSILLTLLFYLPGLIYALFRIFRNG